MQARKIDQTPPDSLEKLVAEYWNLYARLNALDEPKMEALRVARLKFPPLPADIAVICAEDRILHVSILHSDCAEDRKKTLAQLAALDPAKAAARIAAVREWWKEQDKVLAAHGVSYLEAQERALRRKTDAIGDKILATPASTTRDVRAKVLYALVPSEAEAVRRDRDEDVDESIPSGVVTALLRDLDRLIGDQWVAGPTY